MSTRHRRLIAPAALLSLLAAATLGSTPVAGAATTAGAPAKAKPVAERWSPAGSAKAGPAKVGPTAKTAPDVVRGAPVLSRPHMVRQPDGSKITIRSSGDAARHWSETTAGYSVVQDARGTWRYASGLDSRGQLVASASAPVVGPSGIGPQAAAGLRPTRDVLTGAAAPLPVLGFSGPQKTLVILASFANRTAVGSTAADWNAKFFGATDSVRSFYKTASYNQVDVTPAAETSGTVDDGIVGWVNLGINHPNYGGGIGTSAQDLTRRAIQAADSTVDFASYDTNADGRLTPNELHVTVIAAGYEASFGSSCGPTVWGHRWAIGGAGVTAPVVDGKTVGADGYTQFGEFHCDSTNAPGHMATIGIMAHEIGHDLGWPDLYDTDQSSEGVGEWSLMASGSWGTSAGSTLYGNRPSLPDAWAKYAQGWTTPTEITATTAVSLPNAATSQTAYRLLANPGGADWSMAAAGTGEYFLVENRQNTGLDEGIPGCGVLVYHVNESRSNNATDSNRLVDVEEADGLNGLNSPGYRGGPGDAWHGVASHTAFNSTTVPNSNLNSGATTPAAMTQSGGCAATMAATLTGGSVSVVRPPNDDFVNRQTISGASGTVSGTTVEATAETGEPEHAAYEPTSSVWYRFTAPADGRLSLTTSGSAFDTILGVYKGTSVGALTEVASNDDSPTDLTSVVTGLPLTSGTSVAIAVDGVGGAAGATKLAWTFAAGALNPAGTFSAVTPTRLLDTRGGAPLGVNGVRTFAVTGHAGVPASGVDAVALNVTAVAPTTSGYATVYPAGTTTPVASNLNFTPANKAIANLVVVKVGTGGSVSILNRLGSTHFLADVVGWYAAGGGTTGGRYTPTSPVRILDTRDVGLGPLGPGESGSLWVADGTAVPAAARGVVLNVTATGTTANSYLTVWPTDKARPTTSNVNWTAGQTVPNLVYSPLAPGGYLSIYNSAGNAHVLVDVVGWFAYDGELVYHPLAPKRVVDTRTGLGGMGTTRLGAGTTRSADLTGGATTVPEGAAAVVVNTTVTQTSSGGYLTVWPNVAGTTRPTSSNLNWSAGRTVPNLVTTMVGTGGSTSVYNSSGLTHVLMDVNGWYGS